MLCSEEEEPETADEGAEDSDMSEVLPLQPTVILSNIKAPENNVKANANQSFPEAKKKKRGRPRKRKPNSKTNASTRKRKPNSETNASTSATSDDAAIAAALEREYRRRRTRNPSLRMKESINSNPDPIGKLSSPPKKALKRAKKDTGTKKPAPAKRSKSKSKSSAGSKRSTAVSKKKCSEVKSESIKKKSKLDQKIMNAKSSSNNPMALAVVPVDPYQRLYRVLIESPRYSSIIALSSSDLKILAKENNLPVSYPKHIHALQLASSI